jgi:putative membrane protein insertion efficiency factor
MRSIAAFFIRLYQKTVSPDHGFLKSLYPYGFCRFHPSCSEYGRIAILRFGVWRGGWLLVKRLGKCHPWGDYGVDLVPEVGHNTSTNKNL